MKRTELGTSLSVGDRVKLVAETLSWINERTLREKVGEVVERRDDGRVTVRFDGGRLLIGQEAGSFERAETIRLKAKK